MRVLFIAEIVGKEGVYCVKNILPGLTEELNTDFVVANGDGATGGLGIGKSHAIYLRKLGVDAITGGDWIFYKKDMVEHIDKAPYILRPANFPPEAPGRGYFVFKKEEKTLAVVSLIGQSGFNRIHGSNPFTYLPTIIERVKNQTPHIIVDFHANTTAEKYTMFHIADGLASAVIGTGTRVPTADAHITKGKTAVICDAGRTGSQQSVQGFEPEAEIYKLVNALPARNHTTWEKPALRGILVETDAEGRAINIETIYRECTPPTENEH
ncbi:TIGR00282 family metallophosphoesterase [Spirochaetia bacterium 38H-sp]|uniref:TIGR00282 family metallophosphoesterase n=1 Tax=Rarispira pelagica TaxID=3141764 RepID=A0ABU9U8X7_9SPIR